MGLILAGCLGLTRLWFWFWVCLVLDLVMWFYVSSCRSGSYSITEAANVSRGTKIIIELNENAKEFAMKETVESKCTTIATKSFPKPKRAKAQTKTQIKN